MWLGSENIFEAAMGFSWWRDEKKSKITWFVYTQRHHCLFTTRGEVDFEEDKKINATSPFSNVTISKQNRRSRLQNRKTQLIWYTRFFTQISRISLRSPKMRWFNTIGQELELLSVDPLYTVRSVREKENDVPDEFCAGDMLDTMSLLNGWIKEPRETAMCSVQHRNAPLGA